MPQKLPLHLTHHLHGCSEHKPMTCPRICVISFIVLSSFDCWRHDLYQSPEGVLSGTRSVLAAQLSCLGCPKHPRDT